MHFYLLPTDVSVAAARESRQEAGRTGLGSRIAQNAKTKCRDYWLCYASYAEGRHKCATAY